MECASLALSPRYRTLQVKLLSGMGGCIVALLECIRERGSTLLRDQLLERLTGFRRTVSRGGVECS